MRHCECLRHATWLACLTGAITALLGACSGAGTGSRGRTNCGLAPEDSVHLAAGPVYRDCSVDTRARLSTPNIRTEYKPSTMPPPGRVACYSAQIRFVVDIHGIPETETAKVVRANDPGFGEAVLATLSSWRYEPAKYQGEAVRQIVEERRTMAIAVAVVRAGQAGPPPPPPSCR
jgi:hypothetical protein